MLGLFVLLLIASLLQPVARRLNFPFTVLLAAAGVVLGVIVLVIPDKSNAGIAGDFLHAIENLDITSEAVFFLFLPALIFESSMSINVRHLLKDIKPILMLAVIGLLISTFAVGFAMQWISGIGFVACLLLGAIVLATDPVAVVAIFKDLGAPKRLTILVEGESLFNDATAIVLFIILAAVMVGTAEASAGSAAVEFIKVFFGGIAVSLVASRSMAWLIGTMRNMPLVEVTLTVVLAYLSFLIAEHYLHVSGVMAVVTAGLVMGSYGRTKVSPATWHALHETWEQLGFWANSLIFFLVGILVPNVLKDFTGEQAVWLVVLVAVAFAARFAVLFGILPLMIRAKLSANVSGAFESHHVLGRPARRGFAGVGACHLRDRWSRSGGEEFHRRAGDLLRVDHLVHQRNDDPLCDGDVRVGQAVTRRSCGARPGDGAFARPHPRRNSRCRGGPTSV